MVKQGFAQPHITNIYVIQTPNFSAPGGLRLFAESMCAYRLDSGCNRLARGARDDLGEADNNPSWQRCSSLGEPAPRPPPALPNSRLVNPENTPEKSAADLARHRKSGPLAQSISLYLRQSFYGL
jgi:hypothetical protein